MEPIFSSNWWEEWLQRKSAWTFWLKRLSTMLGKLSQSLNFWGICFYKAFISVPWLMTSLEPISSRACCPSPRWPLPGSPLGCLPTCLQSIAAHQQCSSRWLSSKGWWLPTSLPCWWKSLLAAQQTMRKESHCWLPCLFTWWDICWQRTFWVRYLISK